MLITLFILLVFFNIPQVHMVLPFTFNFGFIDFYWFDLLTVIIFLYWLGQLLLTKNTDRGFKHKINKVYFMFLLVGLIPILIGFMKGKSNLLYAYRFFFYFVWVPVIIQFLKKSQWANKALISIIFLNLASVVVALFIHFSEVGMQIGYLTNYRELNLIVTMVMFAFFLAKKPLYEKKIDILILIICMLAIIFDQSRKIYIAFAVGGSTLYFNYMRIYHGKIIINRRALSAVLLVVAIVGVFGLWGKIIERSETALVTSSQLQSGIMETLAVTPLQLQSDTMNFSVLFRIYALIGGINLIKEHPLTGMGAGDAIEIQEWMRMGFGLKSNVSPHNFYISAMLYYGIPIVLGVYFFIVKFIRRALSELRTAPPTKQRIIAIGMIAGFIAFMTEMFFEGFEVETIVDTWLFFGLMLGFVNLSSRRIPAKKPIFNNQQTNYNIKTKTTIQSIIFNKLHG